MITGKGLPVFPGIAAGKIFCYQKQIIQMQQNQNPDFKTEKVRFLEAKQTADQQLSALFEKVKVEVGEQESMIIDVQRMMMDDPDFNEAVIAELKAGNSAEQAVNHAGEQFATFFKELDDTYMQARSADILDIAERLVNILSGKSETGLQIDQPSIVVADDITPSEAIQLDKKNVLALVTLQGSSHSHAAILARTFGIPSLVQAKISEDLQLLNGRQMIVDGFQGIFYIDPDEQTMKLMQEKIHKESSRHLGLEKLRGVQSITADGKKIALYANISNINDIQCVLENDAEGIGLFRSEFLFLEKSEYPSEEEQFNAYRKVVEVMQGKRVIIRTMDIGADKQADYFHLEPEENPALGYRGVRISLDRTELFKTQLRAICRAAAFGRAAIMFPMIISVDEVQKCKALLQQVLHELKQQKIPVGNVEVGIMIETPAAVMLSDQLAQEVDFFSVGTNDLTQYTLAADRQNPKVEALYDSGHPAVLKMLSLVAQNAKQAGIWAGICGELAADTRYAETLLQMGYTELSVPPAYLLELRKTVRESVADPTSKGGELYENRITYCP